MARHVVALHGMVLVLLALPNTTVDAASSDASVLIQDLVHSRRVHNEAVHPNSSSASLHTSFDRDGCPAPKGYDQAHHQACSQAALQQVNICGSSALMRERDESIGSGTPCLTVARTAACNCRASRPVMGCG